MLRLIILLMIFAIQPCLSQNKVSGKIVDELGFPLYKASIQIADSEAITYTDFDGNFTLESPKDFHWKVTITSQGFEPEIFFVLDGGSMETIALKFDMDIRELISDETSQKVEKGTYEPKD